MFFTFAGEVVSWQSKLQNGVALSTAEAKFIAGVEAGKEILWMKQIIIDLGLKKKDFVVNCDSQSVIHLAKNPSIHSGTNHIGEKFHKLPTRSWLTGALPWKCVIWRTDQFPLCLTTSVIEKCQEIAIVLCTFGFPLKHYTLVGVKFGPTSFEPLWQLTSKV